MDWQSQILTRGHSHTRIDVHLYIHTRIHGLSAHASIFITYADMHTCIYTRIHALHAPLQQRQRRERRMWGCSCAPAPADRSHSPTDSPHACPHRPCWSSWGRMPRRKRTKRPRGRLEGCGCAMTWARILNSKMHASPRHAALCTGLLCSTWHYALFDRRCDRREKMKLSP